MTEGVLELPPLGRQQLPGALGVHQRSPRRYSA